MVNKSLLRNRSRPSPAVPVQTKIEEKIKQTDSVEPSAEIHPSWPELPQGQGELFFECTLFLYSVLALFLQYVNLYRTLWWLPKSHWHYSLKFHLINPYLLSCVGLLLGLRVTKCFWNTITEFVVFGSQGCSSLGLIIWKVIEWAFVKTPMFTMVATSFVFSFSRVYRDFPSKSLLYFGIPILLALYIYKNDFKHKIQYVMLLISQTMKSRNFEHFSRISIAKCKLPSPASGVDDINHMCNKNPAQIRDEVDIFFSDFSQRLKHCFFSGWITGYFAIIIPFFLMPERSPTGFVQNMLIDKYWTAELFFIVMSTSFSLYATYLFPIHYLELIHRSAIHLGRWKNVTKLVPQNINNNYQSWSKSKAYSEGAIVRHNEEIYRVSAIGNGTNGVVAEPGIKKHSFLFYIFRDPTYAAKCLFQFQLLIIIFQIWLLVLSTDWQHILMLVFLMFANYLLLAKVFKDYVIVSRIHDPSPEDLSIIESSVRCTVPT